MEEDSSIESNLYEEDDGELFIFDDLYYCDEESFELADVPINKYDDNPYIQNLVKTATLNIKKLVQVKKAFLDNGPLGLFNLFLSVPLLESIRIWTEKRFYQKHNKKLPKELFNAYLGIELAMSLTHCNCLKDYWSNKKFLGSADISAVMSRNTFLHIRSCLRFYPDEENIPLKRQDPLWHSRNILNHFLQNAASIAVPDGPVTLDENTVRTKARTQAKSYIPNKPVKFGIRFYSVVGWKYAYLYSLWDNGSGNRTGQSPPQQYCKVFGELRNSYDKHIVLDRDTLVDPDTPSALWTLQVAQLHQTQKSPSGKRVVFMDNFYTRHPLAQTIEKLTSDEIKVIGTIKLSNVDGVNMQRLQNAKKTIEDMPRGSWVLLQCLTVQKNKPTKATKYKKNKTTSTRKEKDKRESLVVAPNAGYIVYKDSKIVIFYTNDLAQTPSKPILYSTEAEAVTCVHGLAKMKRWTKKDIYHRSEYMVPSIIVAYNIFMNSVDRFDQYRQTYITLRRERRVTMSIFTFLLDASIYNAYAVYQQLNISEPRSKVMDMKEFRRIVITQLVGNETKRSQQQQNTNSTTMPTTIGKHILLTSKDKKTRCCHLCKIMEKTQKKKITKNHLFMSAV